MALGKDTQNFAEELAKFNPGPENNNLSLITLSGQAGKLAWKFARLCSELKEMHEEKQRHI